MTSGLMITAGRGPAECELVVVRLAELLTDEARAAGLTVTPRPTVSGSGSRSDSGSRVAVPGPRTNVLSEGAPRSGKGAGSRAAGAGPASGRRRARSIVLEIGGPGAPRWAATVVGPVQWIATSPLRPRHPRRNWFVQVVRLDAPAAAGAPASFDERDVRFHPIRSGGPGGQRRNKVATAVRAEHLPSGRVVVASGERTLSANRAAAILRLAEQSAREAEDAARRDDARRWTHHDEVVRGAPVRTIRAPLR